MTVDVRFSNRPVEGQELSNYPPLTVSMSLAGSSSSSVGAKAAGLDRRMAGAHANRSRRQELGSMRTLPALATFRFPPIAGQPGKLRFQEAHLDAMVNLAVWSLEGPPVQS